MSFTPFVSLVGQEKYCIFLICCQKTHFHFQEISLGKAGKILVGGMFINPVWFIIFCGIDFEVRLFCFSFVLDGGLVLTRIHHTSSRTLEDMVILLVDLALILAQTNQGQAKAYLAVELTSR